MAKKQESYELMTVFSLKNGEEAVKELVEKSARRSHLLPHWTK